MAVEPHADDGVAVGCEDALAVGGPDENPQLASVAFASEDRSAGGHVDNRVGVVAWRTAFGVERQQAAVRRPGEGRRVVMVVHLLQCPLFSSFPVEDNAPLMAVLVPANQKQP